MREIKYIPSKGVQTLIVIISIPIGIWLSFYEVFNINVGLIYACLIASLYIFMVLAALRADILNFWDSIKLTSAKNNIEKFGFSSKEMDMAFMMLNDLKKGKKPGFFSYPQYKKLFNHPLKYQIIQEYDKYFEDLPNMSESERTNRAIRLSNYIF